MSSSNGYLSLASLDTVLANNGLKTTEVEALGVKVMLRELSASAAGALHSRVSKNDREAMVDWFIASVVDHETKQPLFKDTPEDRAKVGGLSVSEVMKVSQAAIALNGFTTNQAETIEKN